DGANSDATGMSEEFLRRFEVALLVSAVQGLYTFVHPCSPCCFESESREFEVVETGEFSAVQIPPKLAVLIREKWQAFLEKFPTREQAGEAIYDSFME
ncbi:ANK1, partial [Symbiodinium sp. CCMP2456]